MQRAMARQAEAERERRAKVINAEGEYQASERLKDAALVIEEHPIALQLRYLQTLLELGGVAVDDDRLPGADRPDQAVPRAQTARRRRALSAGCGPTPRTRLGRRRGRAGRAQRPGAARASVEPPSEEELDDVPVLRGARGPDAAGDARSARPRARAGWQVRVVPNLYPGVRAAGGRRPRARARPLARASSTTACSSWSRRRGGVRAARHEPRANRLHALVNEGREAGASLPHSHSQLVWLPEEPPPRPPSGRAVPDLRRSSASCRGAAWSPSETASSCSAPGPAACPTRCSSRPSSTRRTASRASVLGAGARARRRAACAGCARVEGPRPLNLWLHDSGHWHLELLPRLTILAGLELGAGVYSTRSRRRGGGGSAAREPGLG